MSQLAKNTSASQSRRAFTTKEMVLTAMLTAVMAVCSWISVPAEIPFTLQTFAVFCAIGLLGGRNGLFSILVYILLGAIGIPVFAGPSGGIGIILGNTGGYIVGFVFIALICWLTEKLFGNGLIVRIISMLVGLAVLYAFGTAWFMFLYTKNTGDVSLIQVMKWCVTPFVIPDLLKLALAIALTDRIKKYAKL
ncbi:MAG: biotin transporter BioY [Ruminococcus flavefaciens]|nr:biotin transporter BioY [Ruminococcus flavefaciens]MCM1362453.1 biotin transporter BioY [Clostridiales bacterium]MCM1435967.1 biotin transporter BioY [Ruminococcus flavefaciens]